MNKAAQKLFLYVAILFLLLLTSINLNNYIRTNKVLGVSTKTINPIEVSNNDKEFWEETVAKNPSYIPGWIELGRMDKMKEIDPNFSLKNY